MVECLLMVQWVVRSIPHSGPMELFYHSSQCSTTGVTNTMVCTSPMCGMVYIKDPLLLLDKVVLWVSFLVILSDP